MMEISTFTILIDLDRLAPFTATLFSAAQTFETHGRVDRITLEGDVYWDYGYDSMGQVTSGVKKDSGGNALPGFTFGYGFDTIGNRETATRESTTEAYTANRLNQINSIDHGGMLHLLGTADPSANVAVDGATTTRSGDLFYGTVSGNNTFESFSILGTLTGAGDGGSDAVARFDHESYIPAGATSRTHDESGNLTEDAEWTYTWDAENRLVQMETRPSVVTVGAQHRRLTFEYDSQSRRTRKTVETWDAAAWQTDKDIRFLWNDWLLSAELNADTLEPIRSYTWGLDLAGTREQTGGVGGLALVKHHKNGEVTVPLYTTNGNVRGYWEIDVAELVAEFEYGPFGELLRATGDKSGTHAFRFSTKYEDTETGLVYYGYRFFDPESGRWLSRDQIEDLGFFLLRGGNPLDAQWIISGGSEDLYSFVGNGALNGYEVLGFGWFSCVADCIEYNSAERLGMYVAALSISGISIPKIWVASVYEAVGNQKAARAIRLQLKIYPKLRWTTFPSSLATYIRTPGVISNAAVARVAGSLGGALRTVGRASSIALVGLGTYYVGIEVKCCAGCLADPKFDPEVMDYALEIADFYF